jgi:hypothetical protein
LPVSAKSGREGTKTAAIAMLARNKNGKICFNPTFMIKFQYLEQKSYCLIQMYNDFEKNHYFFNTFLNKYSIFKKFVILNEILIGKMFNK